MNDFGGPRGAIGCILGLPVIILLLFNVCNEKYCVGHDALGEFSLNLVPVNGSDLRRSTMLVLAWIIVQVILERAVPGKWVKGSVLRNQEQLLYKVNGHTVLWITVVCILVLQKYTDISMSYVYDIYPALALSSIIVATLFSLFLYGYSYRDPAVMLAHPMGNFVYDIFMGRELNPRIGNFDFKYFCELRPGLIGWVLLNFGMLVKQYEKTGYVSGSMGVLNVFQFLYVWDALYYEQCILSTMDITTDGFGYMLAFGDMAWVPFVYSLQARYLVDYDPGFKKSTLLILCVMQFLGYWIFRGANGQKDRFRSQPQTAEAEGLKYFKTERGTKLLISGWWGMARKINYTGDWVMACTWCGLCGTHSIIPYFYAIYFAILLVHRAMRDNHACHQKYGPDWIKYKQHVPYVFFPGII